MTNFGERKIIRKITYGDVYTIACIGLTFDYLFLIFDLLILVFHVLSINTSKIRNVTAVL